LSCLLRDLPQEHQELWWKLREAILDIFAGVFGLVIMLAILFLALAIILTPIKLWSIDAKLGTNLAELQKSSPAAEPEKRGDHPLDDLQI